jgi:hypothetical protein
MALPGFSAESSVGPTTQVYRVQDRYGIAGVSDAFPQLNGGEFDEDLADEGLEEEEAMDMEAEEDAELGEEVT